MNKRKNDTLQLINFISKSKTLDKEIIISFLLKSIQRIVNSQLDPDANITLEIIDNNLVLTNLNKLVISDDEEYINDSKVVDIHLSEAREIDPNIKVGDTIASQVSFDDFSRTTYSKIENSFKMEIINLEKRRIYEKYQPLIGTTVEARLEEDFNGKGATLVLEDGTLCYMPSKYQNKSIDLKEKIFHNVTIEEVYENSKNYQVLVSNDSPNKVREILKNEIPEIANGDIQIVGISRIKGERSKISFRKNPDISDEIDVIGSIVGPNGSRISRVCDLIGEKIDVILYSDSIIEYISNALSPAKIISINKKPSGNGFLVVVPDKHNTLAIGRKGSNVKLTVELIRVNIDICSYSYALENNIKINWNGNLNEEELNQIDSIPNSNFNNSNNFNEENFRKNNYRPRSNNNGGFFIDINEFEKEIAEYNSEISSYEPVDYSIYNFANQNDEQDFENDLDYEIQNYEKEEVKEKIKNNIEVNKKEINKLNKNFKFDKDIIGDIDLEDYDFSDFDDDDF